MITVGRPQLRPPARRPHRPTPRASCRPSPKSARQPVTGADGTPPPPSSPCAPTRHHRVDDDTTCRLDAAALDWLIRRACSGSNTVLVHLHDQAPAARPHSLCARRPAASVPVPTEKLPAEAHTRRMPAHESAFDGSRARRSRSASRRPGQRRVMAYRHDIGMVAAIPDGRGVHARFAAQTAVGPGLRRPRRGAVIQRCRTSTHPHRGRRRRRRQCPRRRTCLTTRVSAPSHDPRHVHRS